MKQQSDLEPSFDEEDPFNRNLSLLKGRIIARGDLPHVTVTQQLEYIHDLESFSFGRFLLEHRAIDVFWTNYLMCQKEVSSKCTSILENFLLKRSPFVQGWREVYANFQKLTQELLKNDMYLASIPCGAMRDIFDLDFSNLSNYKLIGIDIDEKELSLARLLADEKGLIRHLTLQKHDAWSLPYQSKLDLITSCGLNIYEPCKARVAALYEGFFNALKPGGALIISFLTFPPGKEKPCEWDLEKIPPDDLILEKILFEDILEAKWLNFSTSKMFIKHLKDAGFESITIHYDSLRVFPTAVAYKPKK